MPNSARYIEGQKEFIERIGLKVGDTVKVSRRSYSSEKGWKLDWVEDMNYMVGKIFEVEKIDESGISLALDCVYKYFFPYFVLEKVDVDLAEKDNNLKITYKVREIMYSLNKTSKLLVELMDLADITNVLDIHGWDLHMNVTDQFYFSDNELLGLVKYFQQIKHGN